MCLNSHITANFLLLLSGLLRVRFFLKQKKDKLGQDLATLRKYFFTRDHNDIPTTIKISNSYLEINDLVENLCNANISVLQDEHTLLEKQFMDSAMLR
jgi:hypothetical protein